MLFFRKKREVPLKPLKWDSTHPLAAELEEIQQLVVLTLQTGWDYWNKVDFNALETGRKVFESDAQTTAKFVAAIATYAKHLDALGQQARSCVKTEMERLNWHLSCPEWKTIWPARMFCTQAIKQLMRRKLPYTAEHLTILADWIASEESGRRIDSFYPLKAFSKALETFGEIPAQELGLRATLTKLAGELRKDHSRETSQLARTLETMVGVAQQSGATMAEDGPSDRGELKDYSQPQSVGSPTILIQLKQFLKILPADNGEVTEVGFDHFRLRAESPLRQEHELINMLLPEIIEQPRYHEPELQSTRAGREMLKKDARARGMLLLALAERNVNSHFFRPGMLEDHRWWQSQYALNACLQILQQKDILFSREHLFDMLLFLSAFNSYALSQRADCLEKLIEQAEAFAVESPLTPGEGHVLHRMRSRFANNCPFGFSSPQVARFDALLRDNCFMAIVPGEAWSDALNRDLGDIKRDQREKWLDLLQHTAKATGSRPSAKWLKDAKQLVKSVGQQKFSNAVSRWFPLVNLPRTIPLLGKTYGPSDVSGSIHEENATVLRGLIWMCLEIESPEIIRAIGALTLSCYRKIPGVGPRATKAGNAGVYALSQIRDPLALGQLALLKVKVKFGSAQKEIEKAFNAAAERFEIPRDELEEMSVPAYGLTDVGVCEEELSEYKARLTITGTTTTELAWVKSDGKLQKAIPASVKENHKDELKELQAAAKDIQRMLPAQRERIDNLFLQQKSWRLDVWRERYLNHPLVGTLARRILWIFETEGKTVTAIWFNGALVDLDLKPLKLSDDSTTVQLWHPIGKSTEEVQAWRNWLDTQQIQQPFKQAHREIYILTDAELNTRTYSNRFAAHVLKQHQFNALCALRGWKNQLRLMVDADYYPPCLVLPQWDLRAEFWVEGLGTNYGTDTNDTGTYLYLSTDQVRFYRLDAAQRAAHAGGGGYRPARGGDAEPVALSEIPALVFSEVMRDVDMFVGVSSVGNDATWSDGGPEGRYQTYWQNYSFGELNESAKTRKEVLQRLVPKLKISKACAFDDKYLVVKGNIRTYKIHLGSGNILMEPNDQYLCIVPNQAETTDSGVLLPFEGDRTLSIILSKAFLLANDTAIKDSTILSQIRR